MDRTTNTKYIAIDIESTGKDWTRCGLIGIGIYSKEDKLIQFSKEIPNLEGYQTILHNGGWDVKVARKAGITIPYDHDTILMASLLQYQDNIKDSYKGEIDEHKLVETLALDQLAIRHLGIKGDWKIDWDKERPDYDRIKEHCLMDCRVTYHLFEIYKERLIQHGLWDYYNKLLMPLARLLIDVECIGIRLDTYQLTSIKADYADELGTWEVVFQEKNKEVLGIVTRHLKQDKINKCKPGKTEATLEKRKQKVRDTELVFNPNSHVHMSKLLELKGISLVDKNGKHTTASKLLYRYENDPVIGQIVAYKRMNKVYNDFLCKWDEMRINDTLYTNFRLWATRTGRLSSAEPNLQQVPKDSLIRKLFIPRVGMVFTVADAKQLEARIAAYLAGEERLIKAFNDGIDVYTLITQDVHATDRAVGKQVFLATIYGQGSKSLCYILSKERGISISLEECKRIKKQFTTAYPKLSDYAKQCKEKAEWQGYVTTFFGRKIFIPKDKSYKAINSIVQGTGSDLIGFSQLNVVPRLPEGARLLLLVHDEVVIEHKPEDTQLIIDIINKYMVQLPREKYGMPVDMEIKTGNSWGIK